MGLDLVTYLRTEFISAALCTNQIPRSADICVQLGTEDGRAVNFIPRTIQKLITSSAEEDGKLTVSTRRQLRQQQERRQAGIVEYVDQPADNLFAVEDESVDVVISLTAAQRMKDSNQSWKKSVQEAARVLKPGGRFLFVEQIDIGGESYLDYVRNLYTAIQPATEGEEEQDQEQDADTEKELETFPVFDDVGFDGIDLVLVPHIAGVAIKASGDRLTAAEEAAIAEQEERDRAIDFSISVLEGGIKRKRKKKKKKKKTKEGEEGDE